ncbi:MAG: HEAT repeat domain-containing protein [Planctomycetaceae bacterium]
MRITLLLGLLALAARAEEPRSLEDPAEFRARVTARDVAGLLAATAPERPPGERRLAAVALGMVGGEEARDRLLQLFVESSGQADADGWIRLYAAVGLARLKDPGTAIDLILRISTVNPDDSLAVRASPERSEEYFTIDAQICDALLGMGVWSAEASLVEQLRRRHRVRVAIDAAEVLRRQTGLALPFRYNGSFDDRESDAAAWEAALRASRAERVARRPFDASSPRFQTRLAEVVGWLGGSSINHQLIAKRALLLLGPLALPALRTLLASDNRVGRRHAAWVLGRLGDPSAAPWLNAALDGDDADARAEALDALRLVRHAPARPRAREFLRDRDAEVRSAAAAFLGALGGAEDAPLLRAAYAEERAPGTRTALAAARLRCGDREAVEPLVAILLTGEILDRRTALAALEEVAGRSFGVDAEGDLNGRQAKGEEIVAWFRNR